MELKNKFYELDEKQLLSVDGGELLMLVVGGVLSYLLYEGANAICEDFTQKTIGKHIADVVFPAN